LPPPAGATSLIYVDPVTLRRTATIPTAIQTNQDSAVTMATTASQLARAFGILIRQIADLLTMLQDYHALAPNLPRVLDISYQESLDLQVSGITVGVTGQTCAPFVCVSICYGMRTLNCLPFSWNCSFLNMAICYLMPPGGIFVYIKSFAKIM